MSGRRLDVTATQAVSSMMAALTGAIAASGLGIAGTIIGAAFMSLASTVGAAIYKHYLARSNERLRAAATSLAPKASGNAVAAAVLRHHLHLDPDETAHLRPDGQAVVETQHDAETRAADRGAGAGPRAERPDSADARVRPALAAAARPGRHARSDGPAAAGAEAAAAFTRDDAVAAAVAADIAAAVLGDHTTLGHASLGYTAAEHPAADSGGDPAGDGSTTADLRPTADLAKAADLHPAADLGDAADLYRTARLRPAAQPGNATGPDGTVEATGSAGGPATELWAAADHEPDGVAAGRDQAGGGRSAGGPRRRWLMLAGAMLGVFVVAMGAVTAVEAIAGKPLETLIWHRAGSGTTIGSVVHHSARHHQATVPGTSPAPGRSSSARPSSTPPGLVSPAPAPSGSVAPSTGTAAPPSSGTAPSSGASTGTGTQAPDMPPAAGQ
jgi:hypothetical protein